MKTIQLEDEIQILIDVIKKSHFSDVKAIDESLAKIMAFNQASSIRPLIRLIEDNAIYDEAIFAIIHSIESFQDDVYITECIKELPDLVLKSPQWAMILFQRILNNDHASVCLIEKIYLTTHEVKQAVLWLVEEINRKSIQFLDQTEAVKIAAKHVK
ncbi:Imm30 family immunity protein [Acinetobacter sp. CFCC 10889]|uniref:Imm30 family immunity protein n=1 Tax=Acinetobacter sp. CFCC 10889 TaxID=1775557 RepID=UPI001D192D4F|nr:Imm30 family immunity protein [Acinetobacter sp. CFCC 10889]